MRKILLILFLAVSFASFAQQRKYSTFYEQRESLFQQLPCSDNDIIFLGNSITNGGEWCELFDNKNVKNRGISGDIAEGVYDRLPTIVACKPAKIFLLIGVNDISKGVAADTIAVNIEQIIERIKKESNRTKLYVQSVLPVNDTFNMFKGHTSRADVVMQLNECLKAIAQKHNVIYIDLYSAFINDEGKLSTEYSNDGLHLLGKGYIRWRDIVLPYVNE